MSDPSAPSAHVTPSDAPAAGHTHSAGGCCSDGAAPAPLSRSDRAIATLDRLPRAATALVVVALVVVGLLVGGPVGAVIAGLGIACLAAILALTWSRITLPERALRLAVLVFLIGLTIVRALPR